MAWIVGIIAGIAAVAGTLWVTNNVMGGPTLQVPGAEQTVSVSELRSSQRLSNSLFELIPGELLRQGVTRGSDSRPKGQRYDLKVLLRSFDPVRSLQNPFWRIEAQAYLGGVAVDTYVSVPDWGGFGPGGIAIPPEGERAGSIVLVVPGGMDAVHVRWTYDEPGRTPMTADFVWPYGRR